MRVAAAIPPGLLAFGAALCLTAAVTAAGLTPGGAVRLWAAAMLGSGGQLPWASVATGYPPIPLVTATALQAMVPSAPAPALLAAAVFGLLAMLFVRALRKADLPRPLLVVAAPLILLHPFLLRAVLGGPAEMFLALFLYFFGLSLFDLRERTQVREIMTTGLSLLGLAFSHPLGAVSAAAAVPLLAFAVRPSFAATSAINTVLALIFPALAGAGAFAYLRWAFPGESLAVDPGEGSRFAAWAADAAIAMAAPLPFFAAFWVRRRRPQLMPILIFAAVVGLAALFAAMIPFGDPRSVAVAAPILSAVVLARVSVARENRLAVVLLLLGGCLAGAPGWKFIEGMATDPAGYSTTESQRLDALALGNAIRGRYGVLIDAVNTPAVVLGRGDAAGLLPPRSESFALALMRGRPNAPFIAVPDPRGDAGDRLNQAFPHLYRQGLPGYRLIFQNRTWRLFARERPDVEGIDSAEARFDP